jgi:uncharacterized membrane protein HdeD (DUF308 family)
MYILAAWAVFTGIAEIAVVFSLQRAPGREWLLGLAGLASIALGILIGIRPTAALLAVVWLIGAYAIVYGVLLTLRFLQAAAWQPAIPERT